MGLSLLAANAGVRPDAAPWGHDESAADAPALDNASLAWPWAGGVVSTLDFDPQNDGDKPYAAVAIVRGGTAPGEGTIVDRIVCLSCGASRVRTSPASTFGTGDVHLEAFQVWAGEFADAHDREQCPGPYGDDSADAATVITDVVASALGSSAATADFMGAFARSSLDVDQGEWNVLVATPHGVRLVDAGIAGLASSVTLDGSPLTRDHDIDIRAVVARLGGSVATNGASAPTVVAVSSDGYDLSVGVRRWTILTPTRVLVCETGPDPEIPTTLGIAIGLDAYSRSTDSVRRYFPPDRIRVAMMLGDGFDTGVREQ